MGRLEDDYAEDDYAEAIDRAIEDWKYRFVEEAEKQDRLTKLGRVLTGENEDG